MAEGKYSALWSEQHVILPTGSVSLAASFHLPEMSFSIPLPAGATNTPALYSNTEIVFINTHVQVRGVTTESWGLS